ALGPLFYPQLRKTGYDKKFSTGVITCAGYLDNIIPPSIAMILYCAAAEQSVIKLFAAGVIPGIVLAAIMALYIYFYARWKRLDPGTQFQWPVFLAALKEGAWAIMMPVIVFGGLYGGIFSPTEAAGVPAFTPFSSPWWSTGRSAGANSGTCRSSRCISRRK